MLVVRSRVWAAALTALSTFSAAAILAASPQSLTFEKFWNRPAPDAAEAAHRSSIAARTGSRPTPGPVDTLHRLRHWNHHFDRCLRPRSRAAIGRLRARRSATTSARAAPPARMAIVAHRDVRGGERDRSALQELPRRARRPTGATSMDAAIAQAAHDTLVALFPSQSGALRQAARGGPGVHERTTRGEAPASSSASGRGRGDAGTRAQRRLGPRRAAGRRRLRPGQRRPASGARIRSAAARSRSARTGVRCGRSSMPSGEPFRVPPPPALTSPTYAAAFNEVKRLGGDGITTPTKRTADQTLAGIYWAYDGTPTLCAPPRLYNQIAMQIADADGIGRRRAGAAAARWSTSRWPTPASRCWESKYYYKCGGRSPASARRTRAPGRRGLGDGNPRRAATPTFMPLGAPASNLAGAELHAAVPGLSVRATPASAARCSRRCATSTAPTTSRSRSSPTS